LPFFFFAPFAEDFAWLPLDRGKRAARAAAFA
jgi:hypothetical protein